MKIGIGSDHGGVNHKALISAYLKENGYEVIDYGTQGGEAADYPDIAEAVAKAYVKGAFDLGILICGTGIGMSISANKIKGVRAAHVTDCYSARMCREHNHAQILCMGERITGPDLALELVKTFLSAEPLDGRHQRRVDKIMALEK